MKMDYETWEEYEAREAARKMNGDQNKKEKEKKKFSQIPPTGDLDDDWTDVNADSI